MTIFMIGTMESWEKVCFTDDRTLHCGSVYYGINANHIIFFDQFEMHMVWVFRYVYEIFVGLFSALI